MCPDHKWARRTVSALLEVALQSAVQEKCSYTTAVRGLLDGGSVTERRMRAFAVVNGMVRGGVSVAESRLQPLLGDPDNLLPEGTNATDKALGFFLWHTVKWFQV